MVKEVIMPKFGMTQETAVIIRWLVREGERVEKGAPLLEVETDKVVMEVESPASGIVTDIRYTDGDTVPVTEIIAKILAEGEILAEQPAEPAAPRRSVAASPVAQRMASAAGIELSSIAGSGPAGKIMRHDIEHYLALDSTLPKERSRKVRATPAARRIARERGVDLTSLTGTGPYGRILAADVEAAQTRSTTTWAASKHPTIVPLEGMRKAIAQRLQASYQQAPHITLTLDVDMTEALRLRQYGNEQGTESEEKISITAIFIQACAWALRQHPLLNGHFRDAAIHLFSEINIGMAVALTDGLLVPVIHNADRKGLRTIGSEVVNLTRRAREGRLVPDDVTGGTFTISNLGMFGIDCFTAILNPPEVGILAIGRLARRLLPDDQDRPVVRPMITMTLTVDHRAVDGAVAAQFLSTIKSVLEMPSRALL